MIAVFFPGGFQRYLSLPVLGPLMDRYAGWLHEQQYTWRSARYELRMAGRVANYFEGRAVCRIEDLAHQHLDECHCWFRQKFHEEAGSVLVLMRFLQQGGYVDRPPLSLPSNPADVHVNAFMAHLREVRGCVPSTIRRQGHIAAEFLTWLQFSDNPKRLSSLTAADLEKFIQHLSKRMGRVGLQKPIATLRNFLRFLAADGTVPTGLDGMIDRPRVYRQEQLPRSLPWPTVEAFLNSIDRGSNMGKRDYAMFALMTTYGLRACDVVALTLDNVHWRERQIQIRQSKTRRPLELPLIDEVALAIQDYLRRVPRSGNHREIFLRLRAPGGTLKPTGVIEAFQAWSRRSGLAIRLQRGPLHSAFLRSPPPAARNAIEDHRGLAGPSVTGKHNGLPPTRYGRSANSGAAPTESDTGSRGGAAMNQQNVFQSAIAADALRYITLKKSLGRHFEHANTVLLKLDGFLLEAGGPAADLTVEAFTKWGHSLEALSPNTRLDRMHAVKNFCIYRRRTMPDCFLPDPSQFPKARPRVTPYIFSEAEVARLLGHCDALPEDSARCPLRWTSIRLAIVLLYATGLRRGELFRLTPQDYDRGAHTLLIRAAKFHKSAREDETRKSIRLGLTASVYLFRGSLGLVTLTAAG